MASEMALELADMSLTWMTAEEAEAFLVKYSLIESRTFLFSALSWAFWWVRLSCDLLACLNLEKIDECLL